MEGATSHPHRPPMRGMVESVLLPVHRSRNEGRRVMAYMNKSGSPKKKTKGPRIALHLPADAQGLYTRGLAIWHAIKADTTHFPTTYPSADVVDGDFKGLGAA